MRNAEHVDFEPGFACGFSFDDEIEGDGEQQ
jgi:hypothetical protein